jgi:hypothetical protein
MTARLAEIRAEPRAACCGHPVDAHTDARGCTGRDPWPVDHECTCHLTNEEAALVAWS